MIIARTELARDYRSVSITNSSCLRAETIDKNAATGPPLQDHEPRNRSPTLPLMIAYDKIIPAMLSRQGHPIPTIPIDPGRLKSVSRTPRFPTLGPI